MPPARQPPRIALEQLYPDIMPTLLDPITLGDAIDRLVREREAKLATQADAGPAPVDAGPAEPSDVPFLPAQNAMQQRAAN